MVPIWFNLKRSNFREKKVPNRPIWDEKVVFKSSAEEHIPRQQQQ